MKIKYELTPKDLKAFELYYIFNSKSVVISLGAMVIFIIANFASAYYIYLNDYMQVIRLLFYILIGMVMIFIIVRKLVNYSKNSLMFGEYELEAKEGRLNFSKNGWTKKVKISSYIRYAENEKYVFLFLTRSFANIIPKYKARPEKELEELLSYLKSIIQKKSKKDNIISFIHKKNGSKS